MYSIWAAFPDYQVFVDPRIELFPLEIWVDYITLSNAFPGWEELVDSYNIGTLMLDPVKQAPLVAAAEDFNKLVIGLRRSICTDIRQGG